MFRNALNQNRYLPTNLNKAFWLPLSIIINRIAARYFDVPTEIKKSTKPEWLAELTGYNIKINQYYKNSLSMGTSFHTLRLNKCSNDGFMFMNDKIEICETKIVDPEKVEQVKSKLPVSQDINYLSKTFKALGDATRLQIVLALSHEELCVCDLATVVNISISAISHQLRILKGMKIVSFRKSGKMVYYSLDDNHIKNLVNQAMTHITE